MNSDLNENAAWRTFGMLDADEAASFDEAMKQDHALKSAYHEMEFLSAAIAATTSQPIVPQAGQLEKLHLRLGLNPVRRTNWAGISGWAAAAALTLVLLSQRSPQPGTSIVNNSTSPQHSTLQGTVPTPAATAPAGGIQPAEELTAENKAPQESERPTNTKSGSYERMLAKVEPRQLIQKIEILQEKVAQLQSREQQRLAVGPDMAWPIVMRMRPPDATAAKDNDIVASQQPSLTETLGDALASAKESAPPMTNGSTTTQPTTEPPVLASNDPIPESTPSIISIYDPATNKGVLVAALPVADEGTVLAMNVDTKDGPYFVGTIPSNGQASQKYDYELPPGVIPLGMNVSSMTQVAGQAPVSKVLFTSPPPPAP